MPARANKPNGDFRKEGVWLASLLSQAQTREFFGKLTIVMEKGHIRRVVKEESLRPPVEEECPRKE